MLKAKLNAFLQALAPAMFCVAACLAATGTAHADQSDPAEPMVNKPLSRDCQKVDVVDPPSNPDIAHQYMLLLIFKKGTGSPYFGNPKAGENGCIPDVSAVHDAQGRYVFTPGKTYLTVPTCPNDCTYPRGPRPATNDGDDPLRGSGWGILSGIDTKAPNGGPGRHVEIWEIVAKDACHARALYAYHTKEAQSRLSRAYKEKHMLGEILVGYAVAGNQPGPSTPCP